MLTALTIAGSDSGGGAGIQADLKTFHQFGVFGTTVITAITAQNTTGVRAWEPVSPKLVRAQIDAVAEDIPPRAVKSGMLGAREVVTAVAEAIAAHKLPNYVLDPVMVATSGDVLLEADAISALRERLLPLAVLVTPNTHEAELLLDMRIEDEDDAHTAAQRFVHDLGARAALVKGGHLPGSEVVDVLYDGTRHTRIAHARIAGTSTHGTGCTLSAAIAAELASGAALIDAVRTAIDFVRAAMQGAPAIGSGHRPLNHFVRAR
jgi:hydroxymethylpyrimidine/phosphomethylpyrimidine kinase